MDKRRRDSGKRLSEAERELLSFILPMRALWKNNAIQYLYSTFNSYRKVTWHPWRTSVHGLSWSLRVDYGDRAYMCLVKTLRYPLTFQTERVGSQSLWGQIYQGAQLCHVWTMCQASASTRISKLSCGTSSSQSVLKEKMALFLLPTLPVGFGDSLPIPFREVPLRCVVLSASVSWFCILFWLW